MFQYMDRQTLIYLLAADIRFYRYMFPARFEENYWSDSLCCSYVNGGTFACPACQSSRQARRYFFSFDIWRIFCGSHKWQQSVSLQKLNEKEGRGVDRDINNVHKKILNRCILFIWAHNLTTITTSIIKIFHRNCPQHDISTSRLTRYNTNDTINKNNIYIPVLTPSSAPFPHPTPSHPGLSYVRVFFLPFSQSWPVNPGMHKHW